MLESGEKAPLSIKVKDQDGKTVSLSDYKGKGVILYFYPKDMTPGCTTEACNFRDANEEFKKLGYDIIGVSADSDSSHQKFIDKHQLNFILWSDTENKLSSAFGAYGEKSMYGRKYMGIIRSTFVIDRDGKILLAYPKVKVNTHADDLLDDLKKM